MFMFESYIKELRELFKGIISELREIKALLTEIKDRK